MFTRDSYATSALRAIFPRPSHSNLYSEWCDTLVRRERYDLLWGFYDGTIYRDIFGKRIVNELALYENIRTTFSVIGRLIDFHVTYLLGGKLGRDAGTGNPEPTCLPIIPGNKASKNLPNAIATLWAASNFAKYKSMLTRYGSATGDFGIELLDESERGKIRERILNPHEIRAVDYFKEKMTFISIERIIPWDTQNDIISRRSGLDQRYEMVTYREDIELQNDGKTVIHTTFKNDAQYPWPGTRGENSDGQWESPFPFIPVVLGKHIDVDFPYGQAESTSAIFKSTELDGQGSNLGDAQMRMVNGPWFLKGAKLSDTVTKNPGGEWTIPPGGNIYVPPGTTPDTTRLVRNVRMGSRNKMNFLECASVEADIKPLMYPVPIGEALQFVTALGDSCTKDFPEIQADIAISSGDASGRALRVARQKAAAKIEERRLAYDELIVSAHKMACIMGGILGYDDYKEFKECEFDSDEIEHHIGSRPVFPSDPMEVIEIKTAEATMLKTYVEAGIPIEAAMQRAAWEPDDIDDIMAMKEAEYERKAKEEQDKINAMIKQSEAAANAQANPGAAPAPGNDPNADPAKEDEGTPLK